LPNKRYRQWWKPDNGGTGRNFSNLRDQRVETREQRSTGATPPKKHAMVNLVPTGEKKKGKNVNLENQKRQQRIMIKKRDEKSGGVDG